MASNGVLAEKLATHATMDNGQREGAGCWEFRSEPRFALYSVKCRKSLENLG
jgi:hypothetical protein